MRRETKSPNKTTRSAKKSDSGRGKTVIKISARKATRKGGRPAATRSRKAA